MNKRFSNFIGSLVLFICFILLYVLINWWWIKNDQALQNLIFGFVFSFIGAISGGIAGGYGSYLGGIISSEKARAHQQKVAGRKLGRILNFTSFAMSKIGEAKQRGANQISNMDNIFFDNKWYDIMSEIDCLSPEEQILIMKWFHYVQRVQNMIDQRSKIFSCNDIPSFLLDKDNISKIASISDNLLKD